MEIKSKKRNIKSPEIVYKNNKPVSVIIDLKKYEEILERLDDIDDLKFIRQLKGKQLTFRKLENFLEENNRNLL